ncbi:phage antirepressor KilAC domain-containing protein [Kitasatospora aburaviensis]
MLALAQQFARTAEQLVEADARLRELEPKALAHDTLMAAQDGDVLVREAAKVLGWQEKQLRAFLLDEHLIYRRQATCGQTQYDFYAANAVHFNAVVRVVSHTWGVRALHAAHHAAGHGADPEADRPSAGGDARRDRRCPVMAPLVDVSVLRWLPSEVVDVDAVRVAVAVLVAGVPGAGWSRWTCRWTARWPGWRWRT